MRTDWSCFGTGTIGAAQSQWFTFSITPNCCNCFKSCSIAFFKEYGNEQGLKIFGLFDYQLDMNIFQSTKLILENLFVFL